MLSNHQKLDHGEDIYELHAMDLNPDEPNVNVRYVTSHGMNIVTKPEEFSNNNMVYYDQETMRSYATHNALKTYLKVQPVRAEGVDRAGTYANLSVSW